MTKHMETRYRDTREAIRKGTKTEIAVLRDLMTKAHPGIMTEGERTVVAANPRPQSNVEADKSKGKPSRPAKTAAVEDANAFLPPEWAFDEEQVDALEMSPDTVRYALKDALPFNDDIDVWDVVKMPGINDALIELIDGNLPDNVERVTATSAYVDHLVTSLVSDAYAEGHHVPIKTEQATEDYSPSRTLPPVARKLMAVLQTVAVRFSGEKFNINEFWGHVRMHFPEVGTAGGTKPSVTTLHQEGLAATNEEDLAAKASKRPSGAYENLLRMMHEYRSSEEDSPEPPAVAAAETSALDATSIMDTTQLGLRNRTVHAVVKTDNNKSGNRQTRKRTEDIHVEESNLEVKKTKK